MILAIAAGANGSRACAGGSGHPALGLLSIANLHSLIEPDDRHIAAARVVFEITAVNDYQPCECAGRAVVPNPDTSRAGGWRLSGCGCPSAGGLQDQR